MNLYICEKPSLANALFSGLGGDCKKHKKNGYMEFNNHCVTYCFGHMLELLDPEDFDEKYSKWNIEDLPFRFPYQLRIKKETADQYKIISDLIKKANVIYNVGDPDEEGQLLIDEILFHEKVNNSVPVKRILIADYNLEAVKKSIAKADDNKHHILNGECARARSISDQLFGYNLTRLYTLAARKKGYSSVLNIGRVQTAIFDLINERCKQVESHTDSYYYNVSGEFEINGVNFPAFYNPKESDPVNDNGKIIDSDFASKLCAKVKDNECIVLSAHHKSKDKRAPMPYSLATLQSDCARKFGISAQETLDAIQNLYEKHKVLTYPRSNCKYLGDEHFAERHDVLKAIVDTAPFFESAANGAVSDKPHSCFNSKKVGAHHGIIPTSTKADFDKFKEIEKNIYKLVARSYIALLYPNAEYLVSEVSLEIAGLQFNVVSETNTSQGWLELYKNDADNPDIDKQNDVTTPLEELKEGQKGLCKDAQSIKKRAKRPKYYVESTLIRDLTHVAKYIQNDEYRDAMTQFFKEKGEVAELGTEATRASLIDKVFESGLCEKVKEKGYKELAFKTTDIGKKVNNVLPDQCKKVDVTAKWAQMGIDVKKGSLSVDSYVDSVFKHIESEVNRVKSEGLNLDLELESCPNCKNGLLRPINSSKGVFFGCTNHPECTTSYPSYKGKPYTKVNPCPDCGKDLILRKTGGDYWFGCSGFNDGCKTTRACVNGKPSASAKKPSKKFKGRGKK